MTLGSKMEPVSESPGGGPAEPRQLRWAAPRPLEPNGPPDRPPSLNHAPTATGANSACVSLTVHNLLNTAWSARSHYR